MPDVCAASASLRPQHDFIIVLMWAPETENAQNRVAPQAESAMSGKWREEVPLTRFASSCESLRIQKRDYPRDKVGARVHSTAQLLNLFAAPRLAYLSRKEVVWEVWECHLEMLLQHFYPWRFERIFICSA